ncbi:MAG: AmmeMemoRadiSam system protein B [Nitrospirae bacterium]|nr:AmmeMemoRadiSam system protein B [Nitrospirota bacterium]
MPSYAAEVKEADLAGSWYTASKAGLEKELKGYLDAANPEKIDGQIAAIIVPHAGYTYSGPVAAYGYKAVQDKGIKTVIILGFSHRKYFDGIAIYDKGVWKTPLGEIHIDEALAKEIIAKNPRVKFNPDLFKEENSVEMQVPFIQIAFGKKGQSRLNSGGTVPMIVPIAFGTQDYNDAESLAVTLSDVLKDKNDVLIVASTDMSHYHSYTEANSIDKHAINTLNQLKAKNLYDEGKLGICEMCGLMPVAATLLAAEKLGYDKIKTLKYANSGDITGDKGRVVGYVSAAIYKVEIRSNMLNETQRKRLLQIARESIMSFVKDGKRKSFTEKDELLNQPMGAFVTLHEAGELRGCIGNMAGSGPLYQTIADMAVEAATGDPRFNSLSAGEIDKIDIEISVLSPLKRVKEIDEIKIPGHGVIVKKGFRSGVYLPQVADETGWSKEEFMTSLCAHKAGLSPDAWKDPATEIYIFTAEVFGEKEGEKI